MTDKTVDLIIYIYICDTFSILPYSVICCFVFINVLNKHGHYWKNKKPFQRVATKELGILLTVQLKLAFS